MLPLFDLDSPQLSTPASVVPTGAAELPPVEPMGADALQLLTGLRDYQHETLNAIRGALLDRGVWSQIVVLPTGSGKTVVFSHVPQALTAWLEQFAPTQRKTLILAHREELLEQAAEKFQHYNRSLRVDIEQGNRRAAPMADVVVASVPSLAAAGGRRLERLDPNDFRIVIVDEAHHSPADSYQRVLGHFGLIPPRELAAHPTPESAACARERIRQWWRTSWPNRLLLGVTATPNRGDAVGLEWTFREMVYEKSLRWMIERGYLSPLTAYLIESGVSLESVRRVAGDFNIGQLAQTVNTPARNALAVSQWIEHAHGRRTIAFCVDVKHAEDLAAAFRARGIAADSVSGSDDDRDERVTSFRRGDLDVITNCNLLTEGFDAPDVSCVLMCRPTQSHALYMQMVGRGTRLAPGKTDCLVLDVVDVASRHPLVTAGDLFGLPRKFNARGADLRQQAETVDRLREQYPDAQLVEGLNPDTLEASVRQLDLWNVRESEIVEKFCKLRWVEAGPDRYHLALPERQENGGLSSGDTGQQRIEIRQAMLDGWTIFVTGANENLGTVDELAAAFARAERWVESSRPDAWQMKQRDAAWRDKPASEKQIRLLTKCKAPITPGMTRGQASDMLDRFFGHKRQGGQRR